MIRGNAIVRRRYRNEAGITLFAGARSLSTDFFGVSNWYWPWDAGRINPPAGTYGLARYCNVSGHANDNLAWKRVEASNGVFTWTDLDAWVNAHYANGTALLLEVGRAPSWATASSGVSGKNAEGDNVAPTNMADFVDWLNSVGARYAGKIRYWFVRNEPNFGGSSAYEWADSADKYAEMTRLANQVLKSIDANNRILGMEMANIKSRLSMQASAFEASAAGYDAGFGAGAGTKLRDWIDIVSVHTYVDPAIDTQGVHVASELMAMYPAFKESLAAAGVAAKPWWVSEIMTFSGSPLDMLVMARQFLYAAAYGAERCIHFGWGGSTAKWNLNDAEGVTYRAWWSAFVAAMTGAPIAKVEQMGDWTVRVTRQDGQVYVY